MDSDWLLKSLDKNDIGNALALLNRMFKGYGEGRFDPTGSKQVLYEFMPNIKRGNYSRIGYREGEAVALLLAVSHKLMWQQRRGLTIICMYCEKGGAFMLKRMVRELADYVQSRPGLKRTDMHTNTRVDFMFNRMGIKFPNVIRPLLMVER